MKMLIRILFILFALLGACAWSMLWAGLVIYGHILASQATFGAREGWRDVFIVLGVWLVPMAGFVFMLLRGFNLTKRRMRRLGFWYVVFFLVSATAALFLIPHNERYLRVIGWIFLVFTVLWGYTFRKDDSLKSATEQKLPPV